MGPLPFTWMTPRSRRSKACRRRQKARSVTWMHPGSPWDGIRLAVFTVSPHRS
jgi:hypothetical protein